MLQTARRVPVSKFPPGWGSAPRNITLEKRGCYTFLCFTVGLHLYTLWSKLEVSITAG
jgi:hypothetical protein